MCYATAMITALDTHPDRHGQEVQIQIDPDLTAAAGGNWYVTYTSAGGMPRVTRRKTVNGKTTAQSLANLILGPTPAGRQVTFKNGDPFDYRRENLSHGRKNSTAARALSGAEAPRPVTSRHAEGRKAGTGYRGVTLLSPGRFQWRVRVQGRNYNGVMGTAEAAARQYDAILIEHGLEPINFPRVAS